jgi:general secretion pathway protein I
MKSPRGFTLVEVMVALAIVAVSLPVLMATFYKQADNTAYLRDMTFAQMIAANKLTEVRMAAEAVQQIEASKENGSSRFAERDWYWWVEISAAPGVADFYRVDIKVSAEEDIQAAPLYNLAGFISGDFDDGSGSFPGSQGSDEDDPVNDNTPAGNSQNDTPNNLDEFREQGGNLPEALENINGGG